MKAKYTATKIGSVIKELRLKKNIKQEWIAKQLSCSKSNYSKLESGKTKTIDIEKLDKICDLLDFSIIEMLHLIKSTE